MTGFNYSRNGFPITTGVSIENEEIDEYLGLVVADVTPGRHVGKDFLAGLRNFFGGRSRSWEKTLRKNQEKAIEEIIDEARALGADAIIGIDVEDETIGAGGMMNIKVIGTAVSLK